MDAADLKLSYEDFDFPRKTEITITHCSFSGRFKLESYRGLWRFANTDGPLASALHGRWTSIDLALQVLVVYLGNRREPSHKRRNRLQQNQVKDTGDKHGPQ